MRTVVRVRASWSRQVWEADTWELALSLVRRMLPDWERSHFITPRILMCLGGALRTVSCFEERTR